MTFSFRPGTNDHEIYDLVVRRNEYRLPDRFAPGAVVIDIGMHIGTFCYLALVRGAARVYGFEPEPSNYACASRNLAPFGDRVQLSNCAVWRSDIPASPLHFSASSDVTNAGGGTLILQTDGPLVNVVPFDEVVETASNRGARRIDLVKIDCEGAEFPILLTSRLLGRVDRIVGECHELRAQLAPHVRIPNCEEFAVEDLGAGLGRAGFSVTWHGQVNAKYGKRGLFFADRRVSVRPAPLFAALRRFLGLQSDP
ncbi:MAG: FkbM family methyltransferase [Acidobacteriota bacterium]